MRHERRHVDEVSGAGLIHEFQTVSPAKARASSNDINHRFQFSVVMRARLGVGVHDDCARPELLGSDSGMRDGFGARHSSSLRCIRIQLAASNDSNAVMFPIGLVARLWIGHRLLLLLAAVSRSLS